MYKLMLPIFYILNNRGTLYGLLACSTAFDTIYCVVLSAETFAFDPFRAKFFCNRASLGDKKLEFCNHCYIDPVLCKPFSRFLKPVPCPKRGVSAGVRGLFAAFGGRGVPRRGFDSFPHKAAEFAF